MHNRSCPWPPIPPSLWGSGAAAPSEGMGGLAGELGGVVEREVPQGEGRAQRLFVLLLQPHPIHHGAESHPMQQPSDFYKSALENLSRAT